MLHLTLYNNSSEQNKVNKTLSEIITLEGSLLESTSVIHPSMQIYLTGEKINGYVIDDDSEYVVYNGVKLTFDSFVYDVVLSSNYCKIPEFNRYYFITDITSVRRNIWQIELQVDVLMSYKDDFLKLNAFISRNENWFSLDAVDELRDFHYPKSIYYDAIVNHVPEEDLDSFSTTFGNLIISVLADDGSESARKPMYQPDNIGIINTKIDSALLGIDNNTLFYSGWYDKYELSDLLKEIYKSESLRSYVKYIKAYPFTFEQRGYLDGTDPEGTWSRHFHIGDKDDIYAGNNPGAQQPKYNVIIKCIADFILDESLGYSVTDEWLNAEPYKTVEIWIPFYNFIKVPYVKIHNHELKLYYLTTIGDGSTTAILYDYTDNKILFSSKVECSIDFALSTTNSYENEKKKDALITSTAIGALSSVISTALGVVTSNPVMVAGGVMGGVSTVTKAVTSASQIIDTANVGSASVSSGVFNSLKPFIKRTVQVPIALGNEAEYRHLFGKPLKEIHKLNELSGFTKVDEILIDGIKNITKSEEDTLVALLKEGIIL